MLDDTGVQQNGKQQTENGPVKMRVVVDAIPCVFRRPYAIPQIEDGKQPRGHGDNKENAQHSCRLKKNKTEQHRAYRPRSSQTIVMRITAFFKYRADIAQHQTQHIEQRKLYMPPGA